MFAPPAAGARAAGRVDTVRPIGIFDRITNVFRVAGAPEHPDGLDELVVGDAAYDDWDVVADYPELETARAFRQSLSERGMEAVLTSDWPLDEFGRGDIALRVPPGRGIEAEEMLEPADPE